MNQNFVLFCAVLSICSFTYYVNAKLHIGIYYESLCPDCMRFMKTQLAPTYDKVKDDVEILFVPFGKAKSYNGGVSFACQHGLRECAINKVQSCVLNLLAGDQNLQVKYVTCQMERFADPTDQKCSRQVDVDFARVWECTRGALGKSLQDQAENFTKMFSPKFIPTIVYNHQFNQSLQNSSLTDFYGVVKGLLKILDMTKL